MDRLDEFYMDTAIAAAKMSRAVRLKVGAVVVFDRNIIGWGFNGTPAGECNTCEDKVYKDDFLSEVNVTDEEFPYSDEVGVYKLVTKPNVIHAEENAILKIACSSNSTMGATMFSTHSPCYTCARMLHGAGFRRLLYINDFWDQRPVDFLKSKGITCEIYNTQESIN
jgi:dCMP deaminase